MIPFAIMKYMVDYHGLPKDASQDTAARKWETIKGTLPKETLESLAAKCRDEESGNLLFVMQAMADSAVSKAINTGGSQPNTNTNTNNNATKAGSFSDIMSTMNTDTNTDSIRVKDPSERYLTTKSLAKHKTTGQPVQLQGCPVYEPSQLELAKIGAYFKSFLRGQAHHLSQSGVPLPTISEHEEQLLKEMAAKDRFYGKTAEGAEVVGKTLEELNIKAGLLNDATSGGQYLIPEAFDEALITFPLLHSELLPLIDLKTTNRDTVESASVSNPTMTWGTSEGSALTAFDATSMVAQISATVFPVACAIEFGRDFASDSPVDVGATLTEVMGQALAKELDDVIAAGNGTTQPEGIFTASGTTSVTSENGSTGPWTLDDIESLLFGIDKQYRVNSLNPAFITNDTTYARWRALALGTSDARRLLGMDHESYTTLHRPHRINGDAGNAEAAFCAMKKYRMWRRAGAEMFFTQEGKTLALANTALLMIRGRYAGELVDVNACAVCDDGQS